MNLIEAIQLVADEYCAKILIALYKRELSPKQLIKGYGIPQAACYRRIKDLLDAGLIKVVREELPRRGSKKKSFYTANLKEFIIHYKDGKLRVRFVLSSGVQKEFSS